MSQGLSQKARARRELFVQALDTTEEFFNAIQGLSDPGQAWQHAEWRLTMAAEMVAIRVNTEWEHFSHDIMILSLAQDTSKLAETLALSGIATGPRNAPSPVHEHMAEALLTSRSYLEFRDVDALRASAKKWLSDAHNPFEQLAIAQRQTIRNLRITRNAIAHRSRQSLAEIKEKVLSKNPATKNLTQPGEYLISGTPRVMHIILAELRTAAQIVK